MAGKPQVSIVGSGNLASSLAVSLCSAGYTIGEIVARPAVASMKRARVLANEIGARAATTQQAVLDADVVWFCVSDREIAAAARALAGRDWKGRVALHSSGALTSEELSSLRRRGAAVASVHPLMTFVRGSRPLLDGVSFAIEGDVAATRSARRTVKDLGGHAYSIHKKDKAAYHAWGAFASPLLTALLATTERVAAAAGVNRKEAKRRMFPILRQTLENYVALDAPQSFSGPIVRGDVDTVARHLQGLRAIPAAREVYVALAHAALAYLPTKKKDALKKVLGSKRDSLS